MNRIYLAAAALLLTAGIWTSAIADSITLGVDCSHGQTISNVITRGDASKPLVVVIRGTCNEYVTIARDDVTLRGDPKVGGVVNGPTVTADTITLLGDRIVIQDLTVTGGNNGIAVGGVFLTELRAVEIEGTRNSGITVRAGDVTIDESSVTHAGSTGLSLVRGASARVLNSQFRENAAAGIHAEANATVSISGSSVSDNGGDGVELVMHSRGTVTNSAVANNGRIGIEVSMGSEVTINGNSQILNNSAAGVYATSNATVTAFESTISGNGAIGVWLERGSQGSVNNSLIEGNGTDPAQFGLGISIGQSHADVGGNTIRNNRATGVGASAGATASIDNNTITGNGGHGVDGYLGTTLVLHGNVISDNAYSGVVGNAHSTVQIGGATIENNRGGAGIAMVLGSKLILEAPITRSLGNTGALWCGDLESSVNDLSLLDAGGDTIFCSGY